MPYCSNTYSALNALAGHFNSFGATAPIPKKRLDRLQKVSAVRGAAGRAAEPRACVTGVSTLRVAHLALKESCHAGVAYLPPG